MCGKNKREVNLMSEILLIGGIAVSALSIVAGIVVAVVLYVSKRRINETLDMEYGKARKF
jgi:hypothetical protein